MNKSLTLAVRHAAALACLVGAFGSVACGKSPEVPAAGSPDAAAPFAVLSVPFDAGMDAAPNASATTAVDAGSALVAAGVDTALDTAIVAQAVKDAPGMTSEGQAGRETLAQNGHFGMVVTLQPGRCYTVIAMSAPLQVSELDIKLLMLPLSIEAGRSPATDKNPAVLGRGKAATCPISIVPMPYKVDVTARKGAGRIAVAVFSRAKL